MNDCPTNAGRDEAYSTCPNAQPVFDPGDYDWTCSWCGGRCTPAVSDEESN